MVLWRDLAGDNHFTRLAKALRDQALAVSVAVSQCGVVKVDTRVMCGPQRTQRLLVLSTHPQRLANSPSAVANFAYLQSGLTKRSIPHKWIPIFRDCGEIGRAHV